MKQTVVRPLGIVTKPNEYSEMPPGSLWVGDNIQISRSGIIEPRNQFMYLGVLDTEYDKAVKLWPMPENSGVNSLDILAVAEEPALNKRLYSCTFNLPGYPDSMAQEVFYNKPGQHFSFTRDQVHFSNVRHRVVITNDKPPAITSLVTPTVARQAGLPAPMITAIGAGSGGGGAWTGETYKGYAAVLRYEEPDGYVVRGPVSGKVVSKCWASAPNVMQTGVGFTWSKDAVLSEGMVIEVYRTLEAATRDEVGDDYRKAYEITLTAADIAAGYVGSDDTSFDDALEGAYLYTNSAQDGAGKTNNMPPLSRDVCTFSGATFYVDSDLTQQLVTRVPNTWGDLVTETERRYGIGTRHTLAAFTEGSNVVVFNDATGVVPGQVFIGPGNVDPSVRKVVSVAFNNVTVDGPPWPWTSGPTIDVTTRDVIVIDGVELVANTAGDFFQRLAEHVTAGTLRTMVYGDPAIEVSSSSFNLAPNVRGQGLLFTQGDPSAPPFTISATHGDLYSPQLPEIGSTPKQSKSDKRTNRAHFSKIQQPEAVPPSNFIWIGSATIIKLWATQDSLFAFCTDGIYRINGDGDDWSVKPVDPDTVLLSADAVDSMENVIYAFTNIGLIALTDSGAVQKISAPIYQADPTDRWRVTAFPAHAQVVCDKTKHEVWVNFTEHEDANGQWIASYVWNTLTGTLVTQSFEQPSTLVYSPIYDLITTTWGQLRQYNPNEWMPTKVEFNSVYAGDVGVLKQWIDTTLFFEDVSKTREFTPTFDGYSYPVPYRLEAQTGSFDHVVAPTLEASHNKHMRFGFETAGDGESPATYYRLKGLTYRFRVAAEPLTR